MNRADDIVINHIIVALHIFLIRLDYTGSTLFVLGKKFVSIAGFIIRFYEINYGFSLQSKQVLNSYSCENMKLFLSDICRLRK